MSSSKPSRVRAPLLITFFAVALPILFLLGWAVGRHSAIGTSMSPDTFSSWVSALATVAIAVLTFILAKETWYLREAQTQQLAELKRENIRPNINVQLDPSRVGLNFVDVKISNLGKGIARKVVVEFLDRHGARVAEGVDPVVEKFRKLAIFRQGIESMGIGQVISSFLFSFIDLKGELKGEIFKPLLKMVVRFEDIEGNQYKNEFVVDFSQYQGLSELGGGDPLHLMSDELKKLRGVMERVAGSGNRLGVNVYDSEDRESELAATREYLEEQRSIAQSNGLRVPGAERP